MAARRSAGVVSCATSAVWDLLPLPRFPRRHACTVCAIGDEDSVEPSETHRDAVRDRAAQELIQRARFNGFAGQIAALGIAFK